MLKLINAALNHNIYLCVPLTNKGLKTKVRDNIRYIYMYSGFGRPQILVCNYM